MSRSLAAALLLGAIFTTGCATSAADETDDVGATEGAATTAEDRSGSYSTSDEVWLFGGSDQTKLLGCVTCSSYDSDSIANRYGSYGSAYGDTVYNAYGSNGSDYSSTSPWNEYGSSPPALYTKDKKSYHGLFTANRYKSGRTHLSKATELLDAGRDHR